ncbi:hypothetical protein BXU06_00540 [Aquaspirillum sp. LM1]|nr:hypothetical protein BXU06_00540 [Aquaspirillum sp. LM1]
MRDTSIGKGGAAAGKRWTKRRTRGSNAAASIKGVNIFPSDVEAIVRQDHALSGEYRLIVAREQHLDQLRVEVERASADASQDAQLAQQFARQLKSLTGVSAQVAILPPDTLPRATHKAKRVEDRRQQVWQG